MMAYRHRIVGIYREKRFSGSRVEDDAAILLVTAEEIRRHGVLVELLHARDLSAKLSPRMAFGMCESARPLNLLEKWERLGYPVFNRPSAVRNCHRWKMLSLLAQTQTPVPTSLITETWARNQQPLDLKKGIWVKRWDVQSTARSDVRLVFDKTSLRRTLREHRRRGVKKVILQEHIRGDPIKFYGIRDTGWFRCFYSKSYRLIGQTAFVEGIRKTAEANAAKLGVDIYGGDAVVTEDRHYLIDFNSWPSFAPCRQEAANQIACFLVGRLKECNLYEGYSRPQE
jgi:glutathione synthase/RimK-type ligase-like ATP-grasp enzyme